MRHVIPGLWSLTPFLYHPIRRCQISTFRVLCAHTSDSCLCCVPQLFLNGRLGFIRPKMKIESYGSYVNIMLLQQLISHKYLEVIAFEDHVGSMVFFPGKTFLRGPLRRTTFVSSTWGSPSASSLPFCWSSSAFTITGLPPKANASWTERSSTARSSSSSERGW